WRAASADRRDGLAVGVDRLIAIDELDGLPAGRDRLPVRLWAPPGRQRAALGHAEDDLAAVDVWPLARRHVAALADLLLDLRRFGRVRIFLGILMIGRAEADGVIRHQVGRRRGR